VKNTIFGQHEGLNMIRKCHLQLTTALSTALLAWSVPTLAQTAQNERVQTAEPMGGDIVVTARKREESLLKTPVTVTAMTSEMLEAKGIVSMQSLASSTPGININNSSSGHADRSFQQISLRGFTPVSTTATTTSLFIDGVPVASPSPFTSISDPERIEILKGPQSAYFGRNTFAGAINFVNKVPTDEWHGQVTGMVGTRGNWRLRGSVEGPILGDALTFRVTADGFDKNGSWKNSFDSSTLGDESTRNASLLIVAKPTDKLTIKAFGMRTKDEDGASAQTRIVAKDITTPGGTVVYKNKSNCTTAAGRAFICGTTPSLINPVGANTAFTSKLQDWLANPAGRLVSADDTVDHYGLLRYTTHAHLTADYEINDNISISLLGGHNKEKWTTLVDLDGFNSSAFTGSTYYNGAYYDFPYLIERKTSDWSGEGRVNYDIGAAHGVFGVSYLEATTQTGSGTPIYGGRPGTTGKNGNKTSGVFGGLTYDFTDQFSVSVEGRYQVDDIAVFAGPNGQTVQGSTYIPAGFYAANSKLIGGKFKNFTPRVIANFQIDPDIMVYASFSKGVNPSQFNSFMIAQTTTASQQAAAGALGIPLTVDPEELTNYEVGVKGKALGGSLTYTAAAYYAQWKKQITAYSFILDGVLFSGVNNSGATDLYGAEFETHWRLSDLVSIDASGAYTGTDIKKFVSPAVTAYSGISDFGGKEMARTSKWSANVGLQLGGDIRGIDESTWFARADYSFKSGVWADQANILKTQDRHLVNLRAGVSKGKASLELFVNNAFNNKAYTSIDDNWAISPTETFAVYNAVLVGLPELRTAGVQVKLAF
jgi:iron complex outermembrane receptor protein